MKSLLTPVVQTSEAFTDEHRHPYFHCNNLWLDIAALQERLTVTGGVLGLPLIRNEKTVDPTDPTSPGVLQLETAMGAAIEVFPGARAIAVERNRFLPVKTTNELLLLRSDVYSLDGYARPVTALTALPEIDLDPNYYKTISQFDQRIHVVPSLRDAHSLRVRGDWTGKALTGWAPQLLAKHPSFPPAARQRVRPYPA